MLYGVRLILCSFLLPNDGQCRTAIVVHHRGGFVLSRNGFRILFSCLLPLATSQSASAGFMTFKTVSGGTTEDTNPVSAMVKFDISAGVIKVEIYNLLADPLAANQAISGLQFTTSNPNNPG